MTRRRQEDSRRSAVARSSGVSRSSAARGPTGIRARRSRPTRSRSGVPAGGAGSAALNAATLYTPSSGWSRPPGSTPIAPSTAVRPEPASRAGEPPRRRRARPRRRRRRASPRAPGRRPRPTAPPPDLRPAAPPAPTDAGQPGPRRVLRRCDDDDVPEGRPPPPTPGRGRRARARGRRRAERRSCRAPPSVVTRPPASTTTAVPTTAVCPL